MHCNRWLALAIATLVSQRAAADTSEVTATAGAEASRWPSRVFDRPLTLPQGLLLAGPDFIAVRDGDTTHMIGDLGVGVGITDAVEINTLTPTGTFVAGENPRGAWDLGLGVKLLRGALDGKLEVIARGVFGYDFDANSARPVRIGLQAAYAVRPWFALLVHDTGVMPGMTADVFGDHKVTLGLPFGAGVQVMDRVFVEADTNLVSAWAIHGGSTMTAADGMPALVTATWTVGNGALDLLAYTGVNDCGHASDTAFFGLGARYYAGSR